MSTLAPQVSSTPSPRAHLFGVSAAMVTPFRSDGEIDTDRAAGHAGRLVGDGLDGVTLFGTTGEGSSLGLRDRERLLDAVLDAGISPDRITIGITACDLDTAEAQSRLAFRRGVSRLLVAPPFYFKGIDDAGLHDWIAQLVGRCADGAPQVILYHIPQVTSVPLGIDLIRGLKNSCGDAIFGVKDSGGDWDHTAELLPMDDLVILVGDERLLARAAPLGGAGAISGMANLYPARLSALVHEGRTDSELDALVDKVVGAPVTPMVKALLAAMRNEPDWARVRPPLRPADPDLVARLSAMLPAPPPPPETA